VSSLLLLWMALDSHPTRYSGSWFNALGLPPFDYDQVITLIYLKISISDFLTLFSARTGEKWFWAHVPSKVLLGGACLSLFVSTMVATFWPMGRPDGIPTFGLAYSTDAEHQTQHRLMPLYVWLYCIFWWFVQDVAKVFAFQLMDKWDLFSFRTMTDPSYQFIEARKAATPGTENPNAPMLVNGDKPKNYGSSH
jgi:H+-transporting ATPase